MLTRGPMQGYVCYDLIESAPRGFYDANLYRAAGAN